MSVKVGSWYISSVGTRAIVESHRSTSVKVFLESNQIRVIDEEKFLEHWTLIEEENENKTTVTPSVKYDYDC